MGYLGEGLTLVILGNQSRFLAFPAVSARKTFWKKQ